MKTSFVLLASLVALPIAVGSAGEQYKCDLISDEGNGVFRRDVGQYVVLSLEQDRVRSQIHVKGTDKDVTFATCEKVQTGSSNFSRWFETECKKLQSLDGLTFSYEYFLIGAYAGISPVIDKNYPIYAAIESASKSAGVDIPDRTFVIYASRKPVYEFFCYRGERVN